MASSEQYEYPVIVVDPLGKHSFKTSGLAVAALAAVLGIVSASLRVVLATHRTSLKRLLDMPLAVLGTAAADFAAFHWHPVGWLVTGASLWLWNEILADDAKASL